MPVAAETSTAVGRDGATTAGKGIAKSRRSETRTEREKQRKSKRGRREEDELGCNESSKGRGERVAGTVSASLACTPTPEMVQHAMKRERQAGRQAGTPTARGQTKPPIG